MLVKIKRLGSIDNKEVDLYVVINKRERISLSYTLKKQREINFIEFETQRVWSFSLVAEYKGIVISEYDVVKEQALDEMQDYLLYKQDTGLDRTYVIPLSVNEVIFLSPIIEERITEIQNKIDELQKLISIIGIY